MLHELPCADGAHAEFGCTDAASGRLRQGIYGEPAWPQPATVDRGTIGDRLAAKTLAVHACALCRCAFNIRNAYRWAKLAFGYARSSTEVTAKPRRSCSCCEDAGRRVPEGRAGHHGCSRPSMPP